VPVLIFLLSSSKHHFFFSFIDFYFIRFFIYF
jgi:hypothetical protein